MTCLLNKEGSAMMLTSLPPRREIIKVPKPVADGLTLDTLPVLATKFLLRVFDAWQQRWVVIKDLDPVERKMRSKEHRTFRVKWSDLQKSLTPSGGGSTSRDYRYMRDAVYLATSARALRLGRGFTIIPFLGTVELDEDRSYLTYRVHEDIEDALQIVAADGFFSAPFEDVLKVTHKRELALLVLMRSRVKLIKPSARTVSVEDLRKKLGLNDKSYEDNWRRVSEKLKSAAQRLQYQTGFRFAVALVKEGTRVVGVRFDPAKPKPKIDWERRRLVVLEKKKPFKRPIIRKQPNRPIIKPKPKLLTRQELHARLAKDDEEEFVSRAPGTAIDDY